MSDLWINCDWGTTRLRLRAVPTDDFALVGEFRSLDGVAALAAQNPATARAELYRATLARAVDELAGQVTADLAGAPIVVSGMASSTIGWEELPYARLPLALDGSNVVWRELAAVESRRGRHRVLLISGAASDSDVLRGEETEVVGLFTLPLPAALAAGSLVIKPGTHSKHLRVERGQLVGFQTFMTGELADVISRHTVLRHSLGEAGVAAAGSEVVAAEDFRAGVRHARSLPLSAALFRVRTRQVLDGREGAANRAFLEGVLLGSELGYLAGRNVEEAPLVLCATEPWAARYRLAMEELQLDARLLAIPAQEVERLSARGQTAIGRGLGWW